MCLILLATHAHPHYPLIVAANRDEAYGRPSSPAAFWDDAPALFAGRDLEAGGTWLGITKAGRFAAITNYRQGMGRRMTQRSRGDLTRLFLTGGDAPEAYLRQVDASAHEYNGFSLIAGNAFDRLWFYSNRGAPARPIEPGVHGLSNHLLDEPWPKVRRGTSVLSALLDANEETLVNALFAMLADRTPASDDALPSTGIERERERALSAAFIAAESYGTRASTVVLVKASGSVAFHEHSFGPQGAALGSVERRFDLAKTLSPAQAPVRA